jgi:hypothetical protein
MLIKGQHSLPEDCSLIEKNKIAMMKISLKEGTLTYLMKMNNLTEILQHHQSFQSFSQILSKQSL